MLLNLEPKMEGTMNNLKFFLKNTVDVRGKMLTPVIFYDCIMRLKKYVETAHRLHLSYFNDLLFIIHLGSEVRRRRQVRLH